MSDIKVTIIDREGKAHDLVGPTDMNMNIMELCKSYELPVIGECGGMAMCATCQCYLESETALPDQSDSELDMLDQAFFCKGQQSFRMSDTARRKHSRNRSSTRT